MWCLIKVEPARHHCHRVVGSAWEGEHNIIFDSPPLSDNNNDAAWKQAIQYQVNVWPELMPGTVRTQRNRYRVTLQSTE